MNSSKLKEVRMERGMSISELARRTNLSRVTITELENGQSNPTLKTVAAICKVLDENPNDIFFNRVVNHE